MACPAGTTHTFTIRLKTDPKNGRVFYEQEFIFCLTIRFSAITGVVEQLSAPIIGTLLPTGQTGVSIICLEFDWAPSHIILTGIIHPESGERVEFAGRFLASRRVDGFVPPDDVDAMELRGPDPGDTGTGTGQQT